MLLPRKQLNNNKIFDERTKPAELVDVVNIRQYEGFHEEYICISKKIMFGRD